jgi:hypothetical protein
MPILLILLVLLFIFVVETVLTETEQFGWATITLICSLVGAHFLHIFSVVEFVHTHGVHSLVYVGLYLAIGIGWSFVKWFSYLMSFRDTFRQYKEQFVKDENERITHIGVTTGREVVLLDPKAPIPDSQRKAFKEYLAQNVAWHGDHRGQLVSLERPRASRNKGRITAWASFWPFSFVGTVLNDPVRRLFNFLFNQFKALYQRLSDWILRKDVELQ